jgi:hypothetical protein
LRSVAEGGVVDLDLHSLLVASLLVGWSRMRRFVFQSP